MPARYVLVGFSGVVVCSLPIEVAVSPVLPCLPLSG